MSEERDEGDDAEPPPAELGDELDLHTFRPSDVGELVPDYLEEAVARGFREVRIVHGKGTGVLRTRVHAILEKHPLVESFRLAGDRTGGWGATLVVLKPS